MGQIHTPQIYTKQRRQTTNLKACYLQEFLETQYSIANWYSHCKEHKIFSFDLSEFWSKPPSIFTVLLVCVQAEAPLSRLKGLPDPYRTCWQ